MKNINVEYLKEVIKNNESITEEDKERASKALDVFAKYNTDQNKNVDLKNLLIHAAEFLKHDGVNREDKLYADYKLDKDATREAIEEVRDNLIEDLHKKIKSTKYLEQAKRYREKARRVEKDFDYILDHLGNRVLSGDLNDKEVKKIKAKSVHELAELLQSISEFTVDTKAKDEISDSSEEAFNYVYEGMSDEEIEEARADLDSHPINYVKYGDNIHDYLEPIEYFPNTNVRKPRNMGPFESVEHYNAFLAEYYSKYDFSSVEATPVEETENFYQSKLDYIKTRVQGYFNDIKDSLTTLRWLYNHALNEQEKDPEFKRFVNAYEEKLENVNAIEGKIFNDKTLTGDIVLQIELDKNDSELDVSISPLMALIDEENRKKFANYTLNKDGSKSIDDDYKFNLSDVTNETLDMMVKDFVETVVEQVDDLDYETVMASNIEVVYDGHSFVMPVKDFGLNAIKLMELGADAYVKRSEYAIDQAKVKTLVNNNVSTLSKEDIESRLNEIKSEMTFRTHSENGVEEQAQDDTLIEEYNELNNRLNEITSEEAKEEEVEELPEVAVTYPPYNEEDKKMNEMLDNLSKEPVKEDITEEEKLDKLLDEAQANMAEEVKEIIHPANDEEVEDLIVEEDKEETKDETIELPKEVEETKEEKIETPSVVTYPPYNEEDQKMNEMLDSLSTEKVSDNNLTEEEKLDNLLNEVTEEKKEEKIINPFEQTPLLLEDKQIKLNQQYKVVASRKPKYTKATAALTVIGGALTIFGLAIPSALSAGLYLAGVTALTTDLAINLDNLQRAARKFQLKRLAKRHDARVFFGRNDDIAMRNANGTQILEEKIDEINKDLDETFNKKIKSIVDKYTPMVTFDKLANLFILPGDKVKEESTDSQYVSNYFEDKAYKDNVTNGTSKFESVTTDVDIFYDDGEEVKEEEVKKNPLSRLLKNVKANKVEEQTQETVEPEETKEVEEVQEQPLEIKEEVKEESVEAPEEAPTDYSDEEAELEFLKKQKALIDDPQTIVNNNNNAIEELKRLNPGLEIRKDFDGFFIEVSDPNSIVLPKGFKYDGASSITNKDSVGEYELETIIGVIPKKELSVLDPVEEIIDTYGEFLNCSKEELVRLENMNSNYTVEQFEKAWDKYNSMTKTK